MLNENYLDGPADVAIEVLLPGHEAQDREVKRGHYEAARVPEFWLVDLQECSRHVYRGLEEVGTHHAVATRGDRARGHGCVILDYGAYYWVDRK